MMHFGDGGLACLFYKAVLVLLCSYNKRLGKTKEILGCPFPLLCCKLFHTFFVLQQSVNRFGNSQMYAGEREYILKNAESGWREVLVVHIFLLLPPLLKQILQGFQLI